MKYFFLIIHISIITLIFSCTQNNNSGKICVNKKNLTHQQFDTITKEWFYKQLKKDTLSDVRISFKNLNTLFSIDGRSLNLDSGKYDVSVIKMNKDSNDVYYFSMQEDVGKCKNHVSLEIYTSIGTLSIIYYDYQKTIDSIPESNINHIIQDYYYLNETILRKKYIQVSETMFFPFKNWEEYKAYVDLHNKGLVIK